MGDVTGERWLRNRSDKDRKRRAKLRSDLLAQGMHEQLVE